jgi:2-keto-4-pentenoate hydratase/2-oxohepta-3-ene-1,7-dioic acid hydratase in catechol pathway
VCYRFLPLKDRRTGENRRRRNTVRYVRFERAGRDFFGTLEGEVVLPLKGAPWESRELAGESCPVREVRLLAPVRPGNIFCVGRNYSDHARELGNELPTEPVIFLKGVNSLLDPGGVVRLPRWAGRVDYEGELAVIIGKTCRNIPEKEAMEVIFGVTCLNDITARELQKTDSNLTRSKSFDTFCPIGPWIVDSREAEGRNIVTRLNGVVVQSASTDLMIFPVPRIISHISRFATLRPGDVIATGTPAGVGPLKDGDRIEVELEGVGKLENSCVEERF